MASSTPQMQSHEAPLPPSEGALKEMADGPWDRESAEALTRAYEDSELEWQATMAHRQATSRLPRRQRPAASAAVPTAAASGSDDKWLEQRFAAIADRLQQSLTGVTAATSVAAMNNRLDRLEERFAASLMTVAQRSDVAGLRHMETQIAALTAQFETLRSQLDGLQAIDGSLRALALRLDQQAQLERPVAVSDGAPQDLIDGVSLRVAASLAASQAAADPQPSQRLDALEELLHRYMDERRRGEEATASALRTIEDTLSHVFDRPAGAGPAQVDASMPPFMRHLARYHEAEDADRRSLVEAYAEGARVLGHDALEPVLDAADYAGSVTGPWCPHQPDLPPLSARASDDTVAPAVPADAAAHTQTPAQLHASALRGKVQTQSMALKSMHREGDADKHTASLAVRPAGLAVITALLLMFGAGCLAVNLLVGDASAPATAQAAMARQLAPTAAPAMPAQVQPGPPAAQLPSPAAQLPLRAPAAADEIEAKQPLARAIDKAEAASLPPRDGIIVAAYRAMPLAAASLSSANDAAAPRGLGAEALVPEAVTPAALRDAAASGDPAAEFEVAARFGDGKGVPKDPHQAFLWYQRAAMHGFIPAQFRLGGLYERGIGTDSDLERAKIWYQRAAEQGHAMAMHNLAVVVVGKGMSHPDYASAARWFREAAERGVTDSQFNLGVLCQKGQGVPKDLAEAYKWFALAARSGDREAEQRKEQLKAQLGASELQAAEARLAAWHSRSSGQGESSQRRAIEVERPAGG